jgi:hypothetical protein
MVQRAAHRVVESAATACDFLDPSDFIRHEFNSLMASILGRLRLPGGTQVPNEGDLQDTLAVSASSQWVLEMAIEKIPACDVMDRASVSCVVDLFSLLVERFDHLYLQKTMSEDDTYGLTLLYTACFKYFLAAFGARNESSTYTYRMESPGDGSSQPWLKLLSVFRKPTRDGLSSPSADLSDDGDPSDDSVQERDNTVDKKCLAIDMAEIDCVSLLITRSCYFLSHESLRVRISTCDSLTSGFRFLAFVACSYHVSCCLVVVAH